MTLLDPSAADVEGSTPPSDAELILAVRAGDRHAYGVLYERHLAAARTQARRLTRSSADADDFVSEAFAKVFTALRAGHGPDRAFRAYLLTTLRNSLCQRMRRERRLELRDDMAQHDEGIPWSDAVEAELNSSLAARAFSTLPARWQTVLWQSEVERQSAAEIGERLGLRPNAVAALAYRAREGLRQAYLQAHLAEHPDEACRPTVHRLGRWTRGRLGPADTATVREHLAACHPCRALAAELADVNSGIGGLLAPLAVASTTAAYASSAMEVASLGGVAAAMGGSALPTAAVAGAASSGSMISSALGWLLGTQVGQVTAAVVTAVVVGGTAVAAGTGVVGPAGRGPEAAAVAPASADQAASDTAAVHVDRSGRREPVALRSRTGPKGKQPVSKASTGKQTKDKPPPVHGARKSTKASASAPSRGKSAGSPHQKAAKTGEQRTSTGNKSTNSRSSRATSTGVKTGRVQPRRIRQQPSPQRAGRLDHRRSTGPDRPRNRYESAS